MSTSKIHRGRLRRSSVILPGNLAGLALDQGVNGGTSGEGDIHSIFGFFYLVVNFLVWKLWMIADEVGN